MQAFHRPPPTNLPSTDSSNPSLPFDFAPESLFSISPASQLLNVPITDYSVTRRHHFIPSWRMSEGQSFPKALCRRGEGGDTSKWDSAVQVEKLTDKSPSLYQWMAHFQTQFYSRNPLYLTLNLWLSIPPNTSIFAPRTKPNPSFSHENM